MQYMGPRLIILKKLKSLNLFKGVKITENKINDEEVDLDINIEEKQTGTVNAGVSIGSLDGFAIMAGLSEKLLWNREIIKCIN